jgi:predicted nucleic acid-binding protein
VKVVLDSSVLIAASISRAGVCAELLEDVLTHHELVVSDFLVEEKVAASVTPVDLPTSICRDPTDIPVLGTALAGGASVLVTVDNDLHALGEFQGSAIIKTGEFWRRTTD